MEAGKQLILYGSITLALGLFLGRPIITIIAIVVILIGIIQKVNNNRRDDE